MKLILLPLLLISTLSFLGCEQPRGTPDDTAWLKPIRFSEPTKVWLETLDWPECALEDFKQIYRFNEKLKRMDANTSKTE